MSQANVELGEGTFHIMGQLIVRSHATLAGATSDAGNTIIFYGPGGGYWTNGAGAISIQAPSDGSRYDGFAIIGDGENAGYENTMNGGAQVTIDGTVYLPNQSFKVAGSIPVRMSARDYTIVADTVTVGGSSDFYAVADNDLSTVDSSTPIMAGGIVLTE